MVDLDNLNSAVVAVAAEDVGAAAVPLYRHPLSGSQCLSFAAPMYRHPNLLYRYTMVPASGMVPYRLAHPSGWRQEGCSPGHCTGVYSPIVGFWLPFYMVLLSTDRLYGLTDA